MKFFPTILLILYALLGAWLIFQNPSPEWDEAEYIGAGKFFVTGGDIGMWDASRPPVWPILLGVLWQLGLPIFFASKMLALLFSLGVLWLMYRLGNLFSHEAGLFAMILLMGTPLYFTLSLKGLTELPSLFFALASLYLFVKKKFAHSGFLAAVAFLTRFPQGLVFGIFFLVLLFHGRWKRLLQFSTPFVSLVLVFLLFNTFLYSDAEGLDASLRPFLSASKSQALPFYAQDTLLENIFFYPWQILNDNPFLLLFFPGLFLFWKRPKSWPILFLLLAFLFYFTLIPSKVFRFALIFLPYLALFAGLWLSTLTRQKTILASLFAALLFFFLIHPLLPTFLYQPPAVSFYEAVQDIQGVIYTTIPYPTAYTDARFIASFSPDLHHFLLFEDSVDAIIFVPEALQCADEQCDYEKEKIMQRIKEHFTLTRQETHAGWTYSLYTKKVFN